MKRLLLIVVLVAATALKVDAQNIRLGDRIPTIHVDSELGKGLELAPKEHVCLIFIHTESHPCHEAIREIQEIGEEITSRANVVLITTEARGCEKNISHLIEGFECSLAYDVDRKTFKSFGIQYVPCGVIYSTKRNRAEWFGSLQQLNAETLKRITDK